MDSTEAPSRFAIDAMLGDLAQYLLLAGFDCFYQPHVEDEVLVSVARNENRILVSRDRRLVEDLPATIRGHYVDSLDLRSQLTEVVEAYDLRIRRDRLFSRCTECNEPLEPVAKEAVAEQIPRQTREWKETYYRCPDCEQVYWKGSHYRAVRNRLEEWGLLP